MNEAAEFPPPTAAIGVPAMSPTALAEVAITDSPLVATPAAPHLRRPPRKQTSVLAARRST